MNAAATLAALTLAAAPAFAQQGPRGDAEVVHWDREVSYAPAGNGPSPCGDAEFLRDMQEFRDGLRQNPVALQGGAKPSAPKPDPKRAVESTLTAMGDGVVTGEAVVAHLEKNGIKVSVESQSAASALSADGKAITLSDALPLAPRVLAPFIAREAAAGLLADMPASAEREYMRLSYMTRVWLELGGSTSSLPAIETIKELYYENAGLADGFKLWTASLKVWMAGDTSVGPVTGVAAAGAAAKLPTLDRLKAKAQTAAAKAKIDEAAARFKLFTASEAEWYLLNKMTVDL